MRILALDISTKTGWAIVHHSKLCPMNTNVVEYGRIEVDTSEINKQITYPESYLIIANELADQIYALLPKILPDDYGCDYLSDEPEYKIVIEETNGSKARYTQKMLEFLHFAVLTKLGGHIANVKYVNTSDWRRACNVYLTADDKKNNKKVNKAKNTGKSKKELGVKGKVTSKHVAVRTVKEIFNINLKQKDNDIAEAILLGAAEVNGVESIGPKTSKK